MQFRGVPCEAQIASGSLRADDLARTLVPLLLRKANKMRRGCTERTGGSVDDGSAGGLHQLGFMLGGLLQSPELQKAFGISRACAKEFRLPLCSDFLPHFFCPSDDQLKDGIGLALNLLQKDGTQRDYMICRDEVVYARTYAMIYGMCGLTAQNTILNHLCVLLIFTVFLLFICLLTLLDLKWFEYV